MAGVLTVALEELARKPARWSLGSWLPWLVRREARRLAVAGSAGSSG